MLVELIMLGLTSVAILATCSFIRRTWMANTSSSAFRFFRDAIGSTRSEVLRGLMLHGTSEALSGFTRPVREFNSGDDYAKDASNFLTDMIEQFNSASESERRQFMIRAVCKDKDWRSEDIRHYFELNRKAAQHGIVVQRVFVSDDEQADSEAEKQFQSGVDVRHLAQDGRDAMAKLGIFTQRLGFAVMSTPDRQEAFVHWSEGAQTRGLRVDSQYCVGNLLGLFERSWELAEEKHRRAA